jgi:hypothetical protein
MDFYAAILTCQGAGARTASQTGLSIVKANCLTNSNIP